MSVSVTSMWPIHEHEIQHARMLREHRHRDFRGAHPPPTRRARDYDAGDLVGGILSGMLLLSIPAIGAWTLAARWLDAREAPTWPEVGLVVFFALLALCVAGGFRGERA